jgi:pimeloyl-ACP methyl ester carboxylesterase
VVPIASGQLTPLRVLMRPVDAAAAQEMCSMRSLAFKVHVRAEVAFGSLETVNVSASSEVVVRCRRFESETFLYTFLDRDGSVTSAAAVRPRTKQRQLASLPAVVSLHGTGVSASSQADSYKVGRKDGRGFHFGVHDAWVVAPDRHGAHNWEGIGRHSALSALFHAADASLDRDHWGVPALDPESVIYAGHSMGGHGALHLAVLDPDRAIAVILLAAWISKEHYGDANTIFDLDRSSAKASERTVAVLRSSVLDNAPDSLLANILHVPIMIRTGSDDSTVAPFFSRRLYRRLVELGHTDVTFIEVPKQGHWWWDTTSANDGGCMNDQTMRRFHARVIEGAKTHRQSARTRSLFAVSLASAPFAAGFEIRSQQFPQELSSVTALKTVSGHECTVSVSTTNVAALELDRAHDFLLHPSGTQCIVGIDDGESGFLLGCGQQAAQDCPIQAVRNCARHFPPFRTYMETPFGFRINGTVFDANALRWLREVAVYLATLHFIAYDSFVTVDDAGGYGRAAFYLNATLESGDLAHLHLDAQLCESGCANAHVVVAATASGTIRGLHHAVYEVGQPTVPPMMRAPFGNMLPAFVTSDASVAVNGIGSFVRVAFQPDES